MPFLIMFNLLFGRMFLKPIHWLFIEGIMILLFIINAHVAARKIFTPPSKHRNTIDIEGEVVEEKKKLK